MLQLKGKITASASASVCVNLWNGATCEGGRQQVVNLSTNKDWCEYYGVPVSDAGIVTLFKGVGDDFRSGHGGDYTPGNLPTADKWDGGRVECSHGLHWSPTPRHSHEFCTPKRYIAAPHHVDDLVIHWDGDYPQKAMTQTVRGPVYEVDADGNPVSVEVQP